MLSKIIQNLSVGNKPIMGLKIFKKGPKPKSIYHRIFLMFNLNSLNN